LADYLTFRGGRLPASPWYCILLWDACWWTDSVSSGV